MKVRCLGVLFIMTVLAGHTGREASAYKVKVEVEKTGAYAEKISDEMFEFARKETISCIKDNVENEDGDYDDWTDFVGMDVTKKVAKSETFILCKPFVYWMDYEYLYPEYYFPVAVNGKIVSYLKIWGRIEDSDYITAGLQGKGSEELIEGLNKLDYFHKEYVFFYYGGNLMAEDENGGITTVVERNEHYYQDEEPSEAEEEFYALDYRKKIEVVLERMDNFMYQEELEALKEKREREQELMNGEELIVKGTEGQTSDSDTTAAEPDSTKTDKQDNPAGRNLPVAVVIGGVAVLVFAVCMVIMLKNRRI